MAHTGILVKHTLTLPSGLKYTRRMPDLVRTHVHRAMHLCGRTCLVRVKGASFSQLVPDLLLGTFAAIEGTRRQAQSILRQTAANGATPVVRSPS